MNLPSPLNPITPLATADQRLLRLHNRMALLRLLRAQQGLSRADLALRSGLTRSTVSLLAKELIEEGWLEEADAAVTGTPGRRPTPLTLDGRRLVLLGVELGPDALIGVTTRISGEVMDEQRGALSGRSPEEAWQQLVALVVALAQRAVRDGARLLGIGVALPGALDLRSGRLQSAPNIGWRDTAVGPSLAAELSGAGFDGVPLYFHNEADLAAVAEVEFGPRPADDPLVYVSCGIGLGAGIILQQQLFTGATGSAGEIGHSTLVMDGAPCSCGRLGCAEAYIGLRAIAEACACVDRRGRIDRRALSQGLQAGQPGVQQAFAAAGHRLGVLLHNVWATLNPGAVVLGGETVALGGGHFVDAAVATLAESARRSGASPPPIRLGRHGERAAAVGGAGYVLHALLNPQQPVPHLIVGG